MPHTKLQHLAAVLTETRQHILVNKIYVHYRSPALKYKVIAVGLNELDETPCVVYQALYGDRIVWIRPANDWSTLVEHNGKEVCRFTRLDEETDSKINK